jgi:hypothetical protein
VAVDDILEALRAQRAHHMPLGALQQIHGDSNSKPTNRRTERRYV